MKYTNNYTHIKAKFGGVVGSIHVHATPFITNTNDPGTPEFAENLPGGYLKCDGSIRNAREFYALSEILGVGTECKFKKPNVTLREADQNTGELGQFQLPDLGSKVLIPSRSVGDYLNTFVSDDEAESRVGPEIEVFTNEGTQLRCDFIGNFVGQPQQVSYDFNSNPKYNFSTVSTTQFLDIENFQGHAHAVTKGVLNYSAQHAVGGDGKDGGNFSGNSGAGNILEVSESNTTALSEHTHKIQKPSLYTHNFQYSHQPFPIPADNVFTTLNIGVEDLRKLDNVATPFVIVTYIIKF
ncbi:virion structural protein [Synechococcus phage S-PM2]|uniref:Virion structural protein n=1 Tax=Synechococcus phage S-PM2 TaxID=238854 RepID=Q5GQB7_BPSYP|nr:tail collar protein [Synechococcus phage S-PM2]CAF34285.1 virion structural protein [Synechococcus phage S-PM2]CFW42457.1 virion structural protein [Synechococcus phage S-PM2]